MKKDEIITVKSTLGKTRKKPQKPKKQNSDFSMNDNSLDGLKKAMVILPIVIIGVIVLMLIIGINQYNSMFADINMTSQSESSVTKHEDNIDESKLLLIISPDNPLPSDYKIDLESYDEKEFDKSVVSSLKSLMKAADEAGLSLKITEGYVSPEVQHELYMDEVRRLMATEGYGEARAMEEAEKTVPMEEHSEMQSGLAVKFASGKSTEFAESEEYRWLYKNSIRYGFILRYPEGKENSTGFAFDPTHFRYVGKDNATQIRSLNMTLDEYSIYLNSRA